MYKWVIENEFKGFTHAYLNENGKSPYSDKTEADYIAEGYIIVNDDELHEIRTQWEDKLCGNWTEITEECYDEMLNILPPVGWYDGGFFMSERYTGNISSFYQKLNDKCYSSLQRMSTPRKEILDSLRMFIESEVA